MKAALAANFVEALTLAAQELGSRGSRQLATLAHAISVDAVPEATRRQVHYDIGKAAQRSVLNAYDGRRNRRKVASYRTGGDPRKSRYAGGALRRALASSDFFRATPDGLLFINVGILNKEARHWRRLNFGAGAAGGSAPGSFPVDLFNVSLGLEADRRPSFTLPPGFWLGTDGKPVPPGTPGTSQFFPLQARGGRYTANGRPVEGRPNAAVRTRGIQATNFLDAGVRRIANELGPAYLAMYRDFFNDGARRSNYERTFNVRAPRPRSINFRRFHR